MRNRERKIKKEKREIKVVIKKSLRDKKESEIDNSNNEGQMSRCDFSLK